jgi:hypothetical protein
MRRIILGAVLSVGVILGLACNSDATRPVGGSPEVGEVPVEREARAHDPTMEKAPSSKLSKKTPPPLAQARPLGKGVQAVLRMRGENLGGVSGLYLGVKDVRVFAGQQELPVSVARDAVMNLANSGHAWRLGQFAVPPGVRSVRVEVQVDDYGGFETAGAAGTVNARTAPIVFEATTEDLALHGHAVMHVNVDRSLFDLGNGERLLLPKVTVRH